jgi:activator of HSP90 ATPase
VAWRIYADWGRLQQKRGDAAAARSAFAQAAKIIEECAANVNEDELRTTFLNSKVVREVMTAASGTAQA